MSGPDRAPAAGPAEPYPAGTVLAGRYRVVTRIGAGGAGTVLRCHDENLDRDVAIKLLRTDLPPAEARELRARFDREARVLAGLHHPNLVTVHDRGVHEGTAFLVMEYLPGPDLGTVLRQEGLLPHADVARYGAQAAAGLAYLHGCATPVVHRDLKPQHLVLDHAATVKICDFGGVALPTADLTRITRFGTAVGTGWYMSPEQCRGEPVEPASDVYSLGAVLYALLAGGPPFSDARGFAELSRRIVTEPPEPLAERRPDAPPALTELVHAMLAKDAMDRPDAAAVHGVLAALAAAPQAAGRDLLAPSDLPDPLDPRDLSELEAAEQLFRLGRYPEAYAGFTAIVRRFRAAGDPGHPAALAAEFGRVRAGHALGRQTEAATRWYRLTRRARAALGPDHELVRVIMRYGGPACD